MIHRRKAGPDRADWKKNVLEITPLAINKVYDTMHSLTSRLNVQLFGTCVAKSSTKLFMKVKLKRTYR